MRMLKYALLGLVAAPAFAFAQGSLQPGEYLDGSGGFLIIKPATGGGVPFTLHTVGGNKHICDAQGTIGKNGQAVLKSDDNAPCTLDFTTKAEGVEVSLKKVCVGFCGARATLDGMFLKPATGCDRAGVRMSRAEFKKLYDKKAYAEARSVLEPVFKRCSKTLDSREDGWIRNDLGLTFARLGDAGACRKTLEPLAEDAGKTDAKIREELPPNEADSLIRIARAARTNLKLCDAKAGK
ncbi:MAG TPA: hypothetical protein VD867_05945 [Burkholderiales bacterium]|nr:hypothetical protein [Burkholderiales bacterium]